MALPCNKQQLNSESVGCPCPFILAPITDQMTDNHPPSSGKEPFGDPFADRPHQIHFNEPDPLGVPSMPHPYDSTSHIPHEGHDVYDDDEYVEKQPLNAGQNFTGGFYPPA